MSYTDNKTEFPLQGKTVETALLAAAVGLGALLAGGALLRERRRIEVQGRVALITGGSRGLGLILARKLAARGARVVICARDAEELVLAQDDIRQATGQEILAFPCDVTDRDEVNEMVRVVEAKLGPVEILINNAGMIQVGPMDTMTEGDYAEAMALHFWAPFNTIYAVAPGMRTRRAGRIVNISSIGGKVAVPHLLPYSASKFALTGFSQGLRAELMRDNVFVTTVCPGLIRTGSPRNATFKGQHDKEYTWFALGDSLPILSQSADRAADEIIHALMLGDAEVITSLPAKALALLNAILPGTITDYLGMVNQFLPASGGIGTEERYGYESETEVTRSPLTALTRRAEERNNQLVSAVPALNPPTAEEFATS